MQTTHDFGLISLVDKGHVRKARALLEGPHGGQAATAHLGGFRPTALFYLYDARRLALLPLLLAAGADLEARNRDEETVLMQRLRRTVSTPQDWEHLKPLLEAGSNVNAHTQDGRCVLQCWMHGPARDHLFILDELLERGASPHAQIPGKPGPLAVAVMAGMSADIVERLLQAGASPDESDAHGRTAKTWAKSRPDILALLTSHESRKAAQALASVLPEPLGSRLKPRL